MRLYICLASGQLSIYVTPQPTARDDQLGLREYKTLTLSTPHPEHPARCMTLVSDYNDLWVGCGGRSVTCDVQRFSLVKLIRS